MFLSTLKVTVVIVSVCVSVYVRKLTICNNFNEVSITGDWSASRRPGAGAGAGEHMCRSCRVDSSRLKDRWISPNPSRYYITSLAH